MPQDLREVRKGLYAQVVGEDFSKEKLAKVVKGAIASTQEMDLDSVTFDSLSSDENETPSMSDIIAGTIIQAHKQLNTDITLDSIDTAIMAVDKVLDNIDLDSATPEGRGVVAQIIGLNIYSAIAATLPCVGVVSDFIGDKNTGKFKLYSVEGSVIDGAGELNKGDILLGANAGKEFAFLSRSNELEFVTDTLTYTFNLKAVETDTTNFPMKRGRNSVSIGDVFVDDYEVEAKAKKATRNVEVEGKEVKVEFNYDAGTIVVTFAENITAGTPILFEAVLDTTELDKITGSVSVDTVDNNYVAIPVSIDITAGSFDIREALQSAGINIKATGLRFALEKISAEKAFKEVQKLKSIATPFGDVIDIAGSSTNNTLADKYKEYVKALGVAKADILEKSSIPGEVIVVGGSAVVDIVKSLGTSKVDTDVRRVSNIHNTLMELETIYGVRHYYDPTHDANYPPQNGEHTIIIANVANEALKNPVLSGIGLPILPEDPINEISGSKTTRLIGSIVVAPNRDERARKQVRKIKVKL